MSIFKVADDATLLALDKLLNIFNIDGFAYAQCADSKIKTALNSEYLVNVDSEIEWQDDMFLMKTDKINEEDKHAFRVASIVNSIKNHGFDGSIHIDTFSSSYSPCGVTDGNHRIRAIEYLGYNYAPFVFSGLLSDIEAIISECRVDGD